MYLLMMLNTRGACTGVKLESTKTLGSDCRVVGNNQKTSVRPYMLILASNRQPSSSRMTLVPQFQLDFVSASLGSCGGSQQSSSQDWERLSCRHDPTTLKQSTHGLLIRVPPANEIQTSVVIDGTACRTMKTVAHRQTFLLRMSSEGLMV